MVFLGDYNDSFAVADGPMLTNFRAVLRLKQRNPARVVLLVGNHCLPYLLYPDPSVRCAGFRTGLAPRLVRLYQAHVAHFQVAFAVGRTLLVHAGISRQWLAHNAQALRKLTGHDPSVPDVQPSLCTHLGFIFEDEGLFT